MLLLMPKKHAKGFNEDFNECLEKEGTAEKLECGEKLSQREKGRQAACMDVTLGGNQRGRLEDESLEVRQARAHRVFLAVRLSGWDCLARAQWR